jgi:hypothetical protein
MQGAREADEEPGAAIAATGAAAAWGSDASRLARGQEDGAWE